MPSPFPGMNPYLEQEDVWHDFHERFIPAAADMLGEQVDPEYVVKIDEKLYIHEMPEGNGHLLGRGDVTLAKNPQTASSNTGLAVLEAPTEVQLPLVDLERISYIEIRAKNDWQLVTVIELLSPSNKKSGPDREQYLAKRGQLLASSVHFIEVDLLRGWPRMPFIGLPACDYYAMVSRIEKRPLAEVWPIHLRNALPKVPVPLRAPHADARLELGALLNKIYDAARYKTYIYSGEPKPPLNEKDAAWAKTLLG